MTIAESIGSIHPEAYVLVIHDMPVWCDEMPVSLQIGKGFEAVG